MHEVKSIRELLDQIGRGEILLPEFQRGYVWNRDQVRGLVQSLYRKHPTGHLLIWRTYKPAAVRDGETARDGHSLLLLDGQQRLTTLYVLFKGEAPRFYEGESLFFDLYFNAQTEEFRFWQKSRMEHNPAWIGVHEFLSEGLESLLERGDQLDDGRRQVIHGNLSRLSRLSQIGAYTYTVDQVSGDDVSPEQVVEIFNRVNSAGTSLTSADLALAHVCSIWPEAREEMRAFHKRMAAAGFGMDFGFLVRCLAGLATGSVLLEGSFTRTPAEALQTAWGQMKPAFEHLVSVLRHEAFIGELNDLQTHYVLIPATIYLARRGGHFPTDSIKRRFIRWLNLAGLWARYSGAALTKLQQDVALVTGRDLDPTHELEEAILRERGRLILEAPDLAEHGTASAVGRLSRIAARARGARDWFTGIRIYDKAEGREVGPKPERHYIFDRAVLKSAGFDSERDRKIINEVANRVVLTQRASLDIRRSSPAEYLPAIEKDQPGALRAQSVPMDHRLWKPEHYRDFLANRRRLLAQAMNEFIAGWVAEEPDGIDEQTVRRLIDGGESDRVEFKSSLRWDLRESKTNKLLEKVVMKTLAGFLNTKGGTLLIGVDDGGAVIGLAADYGTLHKKDRDGFELHLRQLVARDLGEAASVFLTVTFHEIDGRDVCQITVEPSDYPIYVDDRKTAVFYLRTGNATRALPVDEAVKHIQHRWGKTTT